MPSTEATYSVWPEAERLACFSAATRVGDFLFIAGTISVDEQFAPTAQYDMVGQLRNIYAQFATVLKAHGVGPEAIMKETIFLTDLDAFVEANSVRVDFYSETAPPAAAAIGVSRLWYPGIMVEIEAIASLA